jgi:hypothetical protein
MFIALHSSGSHDNNYLKLHVRLAITIVIVAILLLLLLVFQRLRISNDGAVWKKPIKTMML